MKKMFFPENFGCKQQTNLLFTPSQRAYFPKIAGVFRKTNQEKNIFGRFFRSEQNTALNKTVVIYPDGKISFEKLI